MNYEDFIRKPEQQPKAGDEKSKVEDTVVEGTDPKNEMVMTAENAPEMTTEVELDVHKEVVAELAADKAALDEKNAELEKANQTLTQKNAELEKALTAGTSDLKQKIDEQEKTIAKLTTANAEMAAALGKVGETLARNSEQPGSNQISILDRNPEVDDRFEGETRDHVLEVLKDARDTAEAQGRLRRAQLLEAVLAANEPCGTLAKKRAELDKIFADNMNIINGQVINELDKLGIRYKDGETYLLAKEIAKRSY